MSGEKKHKVNQEALQKLRKDKGNIKRDADELAQKVKTVQKPK